MEKEYSNERFDDELERFIRAKMNEEEEKQFLDFLHKNPEYGKRAYMTAVLIDEIIRQAKKRDIEFIRKIRN